MPRKYDIASVKHAYRAKGSLGSFGDILNNFAGEEWTEADQNAALAQGWGIFESAEYGPRIECFDTAQCFEGDAAAVAYVGCQAILGDALAQKAFNVLAHFWLEDY